MALSHQQGHVDVTLEMELLCPCRLVCTLKEENEPANDCRGFSATGKRFCALLQQSVSVEIKQECLTTGNTS